MRRSLALLAALTVLCAFAVGPAAEPPAGTLTPGGIVTWEGTFDGAFPLVPDSSVRCLVPGTCQEFALTVALGDGYWASNGDGAVEVGIRFAYDGITDLDLYVFDAAGTEVGRSAAVDSNAEMTFLRNAPDGDYRVVVSPANNLSDQGFATVPYEGLAQVEILASDPPGEGVELLPNLKALPPRNFHIASAANLIPFPENPVLSCYPEETVESEAHPTRCLRFDQVIANVGTGPAEIRFDMRGVVTPGTDDDLMMQRIYSSDGSYRDRFAEAYQFHTAHAHIHYRGFGLSRLFAYDWEAGRGEHVRTGNKVGFCMIDVFILDEYWGAHGNGPRSKTFPTCNFPTEANLEDAEGSPEGVWMVQGIDVGWADVYGWNLADQYIDVTGVPDGLYELEQEANPTGSMLETTLDDNRASTVVCFSGDTVTAVTTAAEAAACAG